jgi:hypothetical protein
LKQQDPCKKQKKWRVVFGAAAIRFLLLFSTIDDDDD